MPVHADHEGTKQSLVAESTLATLNESLEEVLFNNFKIRVRCTYKQYQKYSKVNSEIHSGEDTIFGH